jgi:hypothetical protein
MWKKEYKQCKQILAMYTTPERLEEVQRCLTTNPKESANKANSRRAPRKDICFGRSRLYEYYRSACTVGHSLSVGNKEFFVRVFGKLGMRLNQHTTLTCFDELDADDNYQHKRSQIVKFKSVRSAQTNKKWRDGIKKLRMDYTEGVGYVAKLPQANFLIAKTEMERKYIL